MYVRAFRIASLVVFGLLLPVLLLVNIFIGNTLTSFGLLAVIAGLLCTAIGVFFWVFCGLVERYKPFSPLGLYFVYGGLSFVLLGVIIVFLIPVIHSLRPPGVFPD
ncbi:MAG: hypothetical protein ACFE89_01295 [Candidatus Hodarchaeota archaeon]